MQSATDAMAATACFASPAADNEATSLRQLSPQILGKSDVLGELTRHKTIARNDRVGLERKARAHARAEEAACCASNFCHAEESSQVDNNKAEDAWSGWKGKQRPMHAQKKRLVVHPTFAIQENLPESTTNKAKDACANSSKPPPFEHGMR
jgi:hypothetical protein